MPLRSWQRRILLHSLPGGIQTRNCAPAAEIGGVERNNGEVESSVLWSAKKWAAIRAKESAQEKALFRDLLAPFVADGGVRHLQPKSATKL
jgi:hypothetical protein